MGKVSAFKKNKKRQSKKLLLQLLFVVAFCVCGVSLILYLASESESSPLGIEFENVITLDVITPENGRQIDEEWIPLLQYSKIVRIYPFHNGLSFKYKAVLESGHQVMIKLADNAPLFNLFAKSPTKWDRLSTSQKNLLERSDRRYQGWPEIAGFYLDRALGWYKKPPIIGRIITNKELFIFDDTLSTKFMRWLPAYNIKVSMHAWMTDIQNNPPTDVYMQYLTHQKILNLKSTTTVLRCLDISDTLVFDFLLDDHDRKWDFNWKATKNGVNLHWDSGLAWRHGPMAQSACLDILCGPTSWIEANRNNSVSITVSEKQESCERIGLFRAKTIRYLREHVEKSDNLIKSWKKLMDSDLIPEVTTLGLFWKGAQGSIGRTKQKFEEADFLAGFKHRALLLLDWVDDRTEYYGDSGSVLIDVNK